MLMKTIVMSSFLLGYDTVLLRKWFLVNKANLLHNFFSMFISFLYMFWATVCPSSGETTVFMQHLVLVILYG